MWPKFPDICLTDEGKSRKNLNQEIDPTGGGVEPGPAALEIMMLPLDNSGGHLALVLSTIIRIYR